MKAEDYQELTLHTTQLKCMLTALFQKLNADR